jgi:hypothetical protein
VCEDRPTDRIVSCNVPVELESLWSTVTSRRACRRDTYPNTLLHMLYICNTFPFLPCVAPVTTIASTNTIIAIATIIASQEYIRSDRSPFLGRGVIRVQRTGEGTVG